MFPFRLKGGEDASCNNPYQSTQPRVLGVSPKLIEYFTNAGDGVTPFGWASTSAQTSEERANPWVLLAEGSDSEAVPVVIDKNTAWWSLKVYFVGSQFDVKFDSGQQVTFEVVGLLDNTVLQGSLLIPEDRFAKLFPESPGSKYFLVTQSNPADEVALRSGLAAYGADLRSTSETLRGFLAVQNTYLSTFQSLGALGLLLGTFGLAAVQMRGVLERKKEMGLLRAVGFGHQRLGRLVLQENLVLLFTGLAVGLVSAALVTIPHSWVANISVPWWELMAMFGIILGVGLLTSWVTARWTNKVPIVEALRN